MNVYSKQDLRKLPNSKTIMSYHLHKYKLSSSSARLQSSIKGINIFKSC